jgi:hypothetical protein
MKVETSYRVLAQELFNKAVIHIMDLSIVDDTIIVIGKDIARTMINEIYNNSNKNKNQTMLYNGVMEEINNVILK